MNNCGLCQQFNDSLIQIYTKRLKSLAQILLKLKGYQDNWDLNKPLIICEKCRQGLENVAALWESIPEAKLENIVIQQKVEEQMKAEEAKLVTPSPIKPNLPAITLIRPEQCLSSNNSEETYHEPIKLRIKLPPPKRKRKDKVSSTNNRDSEHVNTNNESCTKRLRRPPKRYEDFNTNSPHKWPKTLINPTNSSEAINETSLDHLPIMAFIRLSNGNVTGKLVEVDSSDVSSRMRIICQFCPNVFHFEKEFLKHLITHNINILNGSADVGQSYLYHCKICDKSFREHYAVRRHFRIAHSEERPLKCEYCEASFKYKFNLDYHLAKHIPTKRFKCDYCKKSFVLRYELQIHLRTHTNERPYKCQFCSFAFAHQTNLKNHQKVKHPEELSNQTTSKDSNANEKYVGSNESVKENLLDSNINKELGHQIVIQEQSHSDQENVESNESIKENLLDSNINKELEQQTVIQEECHSDSSFSMNFEEFSSDVNTQMYCNDAQELVDDITTPKTDFTNNSSCKTLETLEASDELMNNVDERFKYLPKNATVHIDSSILKALESSELLGLKKWPKSFQNSTTTTESYTSPMPNETKDSTFIETNGAYTSKKENTTENDGENNAEELLDKIVNENTFHSLDLDYDTQNMSLTKYNPLQSNDCNSSMSNSIQVENIHSSINASHSSQSPANAKSCKSESLLKLSKDNSTNSKTFNFEVSSRNTLTKGGKFINISKLTDVNSSRQKFEHLEASKQVKMMENNFKTLEELKNRSSPNDSTNSKEINNSQSWKVIKISSRPVKLRNICNLNKLSSQNEALNSATQTSIVNNATATKANALNHFMIKPTDKILTKSQITSSPNRTTKTDILTVSQMTLDGRTSSPKSSNISTQSLLKPITKFQQVNSLNFTNPSKNSNHFTKKPLITNIEILPPLKTSPAPSNSTTAPGPVTLIKPPADYKYQCPHCWKYFKQKSPLTKHLRTHTGEKPYKCNLCPKSYADASNYKKHKMLHKNAAEALNISRSHAYAVHNSPAYSTVSDPDPDGIEVMQTIKKFKCSAEEEEDDDDASLTSSTMESYMWQDALENVLKNEEIVENIKKNLFGLNNAIMPKSMQQMSTKTHTNILGVNKGFTSEDPD